MGLFEITITGSKTFYVEANSEEDALDKEIVSDEMSDMVGDFEWEADTGKALLIDSDEEKRIRERDVKRYKPLIVEAT